MQIGRMRGVSLLITFAVLLTAEGAEGDTVAPEHGRQLAAQGTHAAAHSTTQGVAHIKLVKQARGKEPASVEAQVDKSWSQVFDVPDTPKKQSVSHAKKTKTKNNLGETQDPSSRVEKAEQEVEEVKEQAKEDENNDEKKVEDAEEKLKEETNAEATTESARQKTLQRPPRQTKTCKQQKIRRRRLRRKSKMPKRRTSKSWKELSSKSRRNSRSWTRLRRPVSKKNPL